MRRTGDIGFEIGGIEEVEVEEGREGRLDGVSDLLEMCLRG